MAQVGLHPNLVSLIGVITSGSPRVILLSYCEHGSLLSMLKTAAAKGTPVTAAAKQHMAVEISRGMASAPTKHAPCC